MTRASHAEMQQNLDRAWVKKAFVNDMMEHWLTAYYQKCELTNNKAVNKLNKWVKPVFRKGWELKL